MPILDTVPAQVLAVRRELLTKGAKSRREQVQQKSNRLISNQFGSNRACRRVTRTAWRTIMSSISTRLLVGFIAGALSHVIFQGALGAALHV